MSKTIARHSARWIFILIFISLVFTAFFTGFARVSLPFVSLYRGEIQSYVSSFLGKTVEIGALDLSWQKFGPRLVLHDVALDSGAGTSQNVDLKKIYLDLNLLRSWMNGAWQINEVSIVGAKLSFDYYGKQKIRVYGENIDGGESRSESTSEGLDVLSWLMQADRVGLLDSSVTLRHVKKDFSVEVKDLNVRVSNQDGLHKIRVDLQIPALSSNPVALDLDLTGEKTDLINSEGVFNFSMKELDLQEVSELLNDFVPLSVGGTSDLELWGEWSGGSVNSLRIQSELGETQWVNKATGAKLVLPTATSDWVAVKDAGDYRLALNKLQLNGVDENLALLLRVRPKQQRRWWLDAQGDSVALSTLTPAMQLLAKRSSTKGTQILATLSGQLHDWNVQLQGQNDQFPLASADAEFKGLSIGDDAELMGFKGLDGSLTMRDNSGRMFIADEQVSVNLPKWFNTTLDLSRLQSNLGFRIDQGRFVVESDDALVESAGVSGQGRLKFQKNVGFDPYIDIAANVADTTLASARRFFPEKIMKPKLINWLDSAIVAGDASDITVAIKGSSKGFPYANGEGLFSADFNFNGRVKPIQDWPHIDVSAGSAKFRQNGMAVDISKASTEGNSVSKVKVSLSDFKHPVVELSGNAQSELPRVLSYIRKTPLKSVLEPLVKSASGSGSVGLVMDLTVPLYDNSPDISYIGSVLLKGNQWQSDDLGLSLEKIQGALRFSDKTLTGTGITAQVFNTPVNISANADPNNPNLFSKIVATGNIGTNTVLENYSLPISHWFKGSSPWSLQLELKRDTDPSRAMKVSLLAKSNLVGTSVDLPHPYGKTANKKGQLSANIILDGKSEGQRWNFSYAHHLRARVETSPDVDGLKGLAVRFNEPLPAISQSIDGVDIKGRVSELSFDGWISSIADVITQLDESSEQSPILPVRGELLADDLIVGKVNSGSASLKFATDSENISTTINSKWLSGDLHYPREYWQKDKPLKSRLSLLDKQFLDSLATAEGDDTARIDPRDFPPIELVVDRFVWDEYHVADLKMRSHPVSDGMKTDALGFVHKDLQMSGDAYWRVLDPQNITPTGQHGHRTDISFSLKSDDVGAGLDGVGVIGAFSGGQGQVDVKLAWDDAAYAPDLSRITGTIKPELKSGNVLAVEPGAAKILGLFALQAIPRRLLLDFNDVTEDGLLYDEVSGDIVIADGIATTNYMQLNGPIGVVTSSGLTDFVNSTYDQKIVVLPRLTSALPIIGLISAGATAGVGVLVADQILKGVGVNFDEVGKREYLLTGSWDDPEVKRVHVPLKHLPEPENR